MAELINCNPIKAQTNCNNPIAVSIIGLDSAYKATDSVVTLKGSPDGGKFFGTGVTNGKFYPSTLCFGNYSITYVYIDSNGCSNAICKDVSILKSKYTIYVPTAFSPNGDSLNDVLCISKANCNITEFIIYNRWGQQVYNLINQQDCWDGTLNGNPQADGIYLYLLKAISINCQNISFQGYITLIR